MEAKWGRLCYNGWAPPTRRARHSCRLGPGEGRNRHSLMRHSLAKLLEDQLPFLTENWSMDAADSLAPPEHALAGPNGPLYYTHLQEAVRTEDRSGWLSWICRAGAARSDAGGDVSALIAEALSCLNRVRVAVLGELSPQADEGRGVSQELDDLETAILTALVSGYFEGQERRAGE